MILVTGGAGFIGSHLVDELLRRGHRVRVLDNLANGTLDNLAEALRDSALEFVKGDVLDPEACRSAVTGCEIVFHLACLGVRHSLHSPVENHLANAEGTLRMLEACRTSKPRRFFYISSSEVYGDTPSLPIDENSLTVPKTVYGASKLAGEHYTAAYGKGFGLHTTNLRIFNNYGPRAHYAGDAGEVIPRSIVNILNGKPPVLFGDGLATRDFFFVKDTAHVLCDLIAVPALDGETINIGTGVEITMKKLLETLLTHMKKPLSSIQYLEARPADVPRLWVRPEKFQRLLKFSAEFDFEARLLETIAYYENLHNRGKLKSHPPERNWIP